MQWQGNQPRSLRKTNQPSRLPQPKYLQQERETHFIDSKSPFQGQGGRSKKIIKRKLCARQPETLHLFHNLTHRSDWISTTSAGLVEQLSLLLLLKWRLQPPQPKSILLTVCKLQKSNLFIQHYYQRVTEDLPTKHLHSTSLIKVVINNKRQCLISS